MFKPLAPYYSDIYKVGHKAMLALGTLRLYGTWIPRSLKHAPKGIKKILSYGQKMAWKQLHDIYQEDFFDKTWEEASQFGKDISMMIDQYYDDSHFKALHELGYLPIRVKSLPEGIETNPNIPHMTFINTVDGFGWLTLYIETPVSSLAWKPTTSATFALQYRRNLTDWVLRTDSNNAFLIPFLCHDFSARGLSIWDMVSSGLGHATSFRGSDSMVVTPAARYYYNEPTGIVPINSVNASEHSVSTTKIFTVGEKQMILDWLEQFPTGILSIVADTFDLWKLLIAYMGDPVIKDKVMARNGKVVIRPDSGDPVDIICGMDVEKLEEHLYSDISKPIIKGVIELLWDIFGGTTNEQGYKVLDSHIGAIYGDAITVERQVEIYERLADKGFAATNIVLGVGSFTYQMNTRDTLGFAAKGAWFEVQEGDKKVGYDIYKDPVTDDGTKTSLKGLQMVYQDENGEYQVKSQCTWEEEQQGVLQTIYEDGKFYNETTLTEIRERINSII